MQIVFLTARFELYLASFFQPTQLLNDFLKMTARAWFLIRVSHLWLYSSLLWCHCMHKIQVLRQKENKPELINLPAEIN